MDEETREYLEKIGDSARHLLGLINDILDMSRIESGRMILRKEEFSFTHHTGTDQHHGHVPMQRKGTQI